jgi:hypothetical protein
MMRVLIVQYDLPRLALAASRWSFDRHMHMQTILASCWSKNSDMAR